MCVCVCNGTVWSQQALVRMTHLIIYNGNLNNECQPDLVIWCSKSGMVHKWWGMMKYEDGWMDKLHPTKSFAEILGVYGGSDEIHNFYPAKT